MSVNRHKEHILVLPEDDANRQMANGLVLEMPDRSRSQVRILPVAGGWEKVLRQFRSDHVRYMDRFPTCAMILAIDFDGRHERFSEARTWVPDALAERVFILGVWTRPEDLVRAGLGSYEQIGQAMWRDCGAEPKGIWNHDLLKHNHGELRRLCGASVARLFV
jgi:hypothetical protein